VIDHEANENNNDKPDPVRVDVAASENGNRDIFLLPPRKNIIGNCSPAQTPVGGPSIPTPKITPSVTRRAIDGISKALVERGEDNSHVWTPRESTVLPEAFDGNSTPMNSSVGSAAANEEPKSPPVSDVAKEVTDDASISENQLDAQKPSVIQQAPSQSGSKDTAELASGSEDTAELASTIDSKEIGASESSVGFASGTSYDDSTTRRDDKTVDHHSSMWNSSQGGTFSVNSFSQNNLRKIVSVSRGQSSMWDSSQGGTFSPTSYSQSTLRKVDRIPRGHSSMWDSSQGGTFSPTSYSQNTIRPDDRTPRGQSSMWESSQGGTFSLNSYSQKTGYSLSSGIYSSATDYTSFSSRRDTFSSQDDSMVSPNSSGTGASSPEDSRNRIYTGESSHSSPTKHSQWSRTEHTCDTGFTGSTASAHGGRASINESDPGDVSAGGRLWQEAQLQADRTKGRPLSPRAKKFADSIMARTRSRADPDALLENSSNNDSMEKPTRSMINVNAQEEGGFVESTSIAKKRGRVVQLLTIGLLSFLISFLGGFLVLSSCHFVSAVVQVNYQAVDLYFGLFKYSPADSASRGYTYCINYDGDFIGDTPWFGRISSLLALAGGGFSLGVLWLYLVLGRCAKQIWNIAIFAAALSGVLQLSTLSILVSTVCKEEVCTLGPAGFITVIAGCFYFVLAFEMHYNTPFVCVSANLAHVASSEEPHHMVTNLEMTDFEYGAKAYVRRIGFGDSKANTQNQKNHVVTKKEETKDSYVPPTEIV